MSETQTEAYEATETTDATPDTTTEATGGDEANKDEAAA